MLLCGLALATTDFDPTATPTTYTGAETYLQDGTVKLWGQVELHTDGDRTLFKQEQFNGALKWQDAAWSPWIASMFGDPTPHSSMFLLHVAQTEPLSAGTPVLFVPGAGDNGSRGFITMATRMANAQRPVFVLTFAHPHGDAYMQAEVVADAIARITERRGVDQVDVVAHSKGGISAAIYASNHAGASWNHSAYDSVGTTYADDIRRLVLIATPLDGVDTAYRWSANNFFSMDAAAAVSPSSWSAYYPYTTGNQVVVTDMSAQDLLSDGDGDLFPGQRQMLRRQDPDLPGAQPWLGVYSAQQDWYTTYEGGWGYYSWSEGIDAAIADGGFVLDRLADNGVDPDVEIYLLAGDNPLLHNGAEYQLVQAFGESWVDQVTAGTDAWADLLAAVVDNSLSDWGFAQDEVRGLAQGKLILGEITGPSDGLVFTTSATHADALTARGAVVQDTYVANLAHLDLLYASPITGQILIDAGEADPTEDGWMRAVGQRYVDADTLGWLEQVLADPAGPGDSGDTGDTGVVDDTGADDTGDTDRGPLDGDGGWAANCDGCAGAPGAPAGWLLVLAGAALLRRRQD
jgi:pimeloyl-ACP methyl ester carboxylesterase